MTQLFPFNILDNQEIAAELRNVSRPVMLVGFLAQMNLGLGYLASVLREHGYRVEIVDFERDPEEILERARSLNPSVIGFSLIFQFYIQRFDSLIKYLRENEITCHCTMGAHFPSLSFEQPSDFIPQISNVVRSHT